ncbi:MAG TPA: YceD family protein [Acidimicrobiales bacterium]|nr:YceD family protein [Acidimicrobiales bacterium]
MPARMRVGVSDLLRKLGSRRELHQELELDGDLGVVATRLDPERPIVADLVIEAFSGGIAVTGAVEVPWVGECRRCLEPVEGTSRHRLQEIFGGAEGDEDAYPLEHEEIDLEPMLRDVVAGALPLAPLCREDCAGPSPDTFPTGPPDDAAEPPADPRWAALDELRFDE